MAKIRAYKLAEELGIDRNEFVERAAAALGIDRSKLYRRLKQYGVMAVKFLQQEQDGLQLRTWDSKAPSSV